MITILNRIFPDDISIYIYQIYKKSIIDKIMIPRIYIFELTMDNLTQIYSNPENTIISVNLTGFKLLENVFQNIKKYDYDVDNDIKCKIEKFREKIKYLILINTNTGQEFYNKLLTKLL